MDGLLHRRCSFNSNTPTIWLRIGNYPISAGIDREMRHHSPAPTALRYQAWQSRYEFQGMALQSDTSFLDRWYNNRDDITQVIQEFFAGQVMTPGLAPSFRIPADQIGGTRAWQQEFRLTSSNDSRFKWVVGAYFRRAEERLAQTIAPDLSPLTEAIAGVTSAQFFGGVPDYVFNGQALSSLTDYRTIDEETSLFSDASFDITDRFKISAGVRIEHSVVEDQSEIVAGPLNGVAFSQLVLPDQVQNPVTPRLAVTYQYTDQDMVYASASKGYRAGGRQLGECV